jgi:hypothetical protein
MKQIAHLNIYDSLLNTNPQQAPLRPSQIDADYDFIENKAGGYEEKTRQKSKVLNKYEQYFDEKWKVELYNRTQFLWLYKVYKTKQTPEIIQKLDEFKREIQQTTKPYRSLAINFDDFKYENAEINESWD